MKSLYEELSSTYRQTKRCKTSFSLYNRVQLVLSCMSSLGIQQKNCNTEDAQGHTSNPECRLEAVTGCRNLSGRCVHHICVNQCVGGEPVCLEGQCLGIRIKHRGNDLSLTVMDMDNAVSSGYILIRVDVTVIQFEGDLHLIAQLGQTGSFVFTDLLIHGDVQIHPHLSSSQLLFNFILIRGGNRLGNILDLQPDFYIGTVFNLLFFFLSEGNFLLQFLNFFGNLKLR